MSDFISIEGKAQLTPLAISGAAAQTEAMSPGIFDVMSTVDCFIKVAVDASDITAASGYFLLADNVISVEVPNGRKIGVITAGGTGTFLRHQVK